MLDTLRLLTLTGLATAGYVAVCAFWPFTACRLCSGSGKRRSPSGKAFRICPRCKGSARRLRTGRRAWLLVTGRRR